MLSNLAHYQALRQGLAEGVGFARLLPLKLPEDYRAAVILRANLTKDTLVQGNCV